MIFGPKLVKIHQKAIAKQGSQKKIPSHHLHTLAPPPSPSIKGLQPRFQRVVSSNLGSPFLAEEAVSQNRLRIALEPNLIKPASNAVAPTEFIGLFANSLVNHAVRGEVDEPSNS